MQAHLKLEQIHWFVGLMVTETGYGELGKLGINTLHWQLLFIAAIFQISSKWISQRSQRAADRLDWRRQRFTWRHDNEITAATLAILNTVIRFSMVHHFCQNLLRYQLKNRRERERGVGGGGAGGPGGGAGGPGGGGGGPHTNLLWTAQHWKRAF